MTDILNVDRKKKTYPKEYTDFKGVDYANLIPDLSHSPDAKNVWKNYNDGALGQAIETRPGYGLVYDFTSYGFVRNMFKFSIQDRNYCLIQVENYLLWWNNYPSAPTSATHLTELYTSLEPTCAVNGFFFDNNFYIMAQMVGLIRVTEIYDVGSEIYSIYATKIAYNTLGSDLNRPYVPTTHIGANPNGSNGEAYQSVNIYTPYVKNSFVGDGISTVFHLDTAVYYPETPTVTVNGSSVSVSSYSNTLGTVTLSVAPAAPSTAGDDNVIVKFRKIWGDDKMNGGIMACQQVAIFDNRVFMAAPSAISSNSGVTQSEIYYTALDDPTYLPDTNFIVVNNGIASIRGITPINEVLFVICENDDNNTSKSYYLTPQIDSDIGKVYPITETGLTIGVSTGGTGYAYIYSKMFNYEGGVVFLSENGLEEIAYSSNFYTKHKSSRIDKVLSQIVFSDIVLYKNYIVLWSGYAGGKLFLGNIKEQAKINNSNQFEWFYWDGLPNYNNFIKVIDDEMYIVHNYKLYKLTGTNDNGSAINSYWTTPKDDFGLASYLKSVEKRGATVRAKCIENSLLSVDYSKDGAAFVPLIEDKDTDPDTIGDDRAYVVVKSKVKKFKYVSFKFYSDVLNKPFGLYSYVIDYIVEKKLKG